MTAPTSQKPPTEPDLNDLRTDLPTLADRCEALGEHWGARDIRNDLLAAHPAPEIDAPQAIQWAPSGSVLDGVPGGWCASSPGRMACPPAPADQHALARTATRLLRGATRG